MEGREEGFLYNLCAKILNLTTSKSENIKNLVEWEGRLSFVGKEDTTNTFILLCKDLTYISLRGVALRH